MALNFHTQMLTRFTVPTADGEQTLVYSAEKWVRIILTLQTAGPVAAGTSANLKPVAQGRGISLIQNIPTPFILPRGDRLYIASDTVDRIAIIIEPIPWLEEIAGLLCAAVKK